MLSANYRATNALMNTRYPAKDHELVRATREARLMSSLHQHAEIPTEPARTARPSKLRVLLNRLGVAGA